jgi:hypothetical protein
MNDYVVFTPDNPSLYSLNQAARLVLAFCDGRTGRALENAYCAALEPLLPPGEARAELRKTIEDLERKGILRNARPTGKSPNRLKNKGEHCHGSEKKVDAQ